MISEAADQPLRAPDGGKRCGRPRVEKGSSLSPYFGPETAETAVASPEFLGVTC